MSEYQYYEFQTVDRSLTNDEMRVLRSFSTRADISPRHFVNEYSWGNFKGDEDKWMEEYFDGFLYYANWGTHILKLRLPRELLDSKTVQQYCCGDYFSMRLANDKIILSFLSENEDGGEWESDFRLSSFLSLRSDLGRGDFRCLYLGWLSGLQYDDCNEEEIEPPVPPGLADLNPALIEFAKFLCINPDLIAAASKRSISVLQTTPNLKDFQKWLSTLSINEKDVFLSDILGGILTNDQTAAIKLAQCFNKFWRPQQECQQFSHQRTVAQLLDEAKCFTQMRLKLEAEKAAAEKAKQLKLEQLAREKRLKEIAGHEPVLWDRIEALVIEKKAKSYDKAVELLIDLRDLAVRDDSSNFLAKLNDLKRRHSAKSSFIARLQTIAPRS